MAEKHIYSVNLRKAKQASRPNRAAKAMRILRQHVRQHSQVEDVSISNSVNERMFARGAQKPPTSLEIQVVEEGGTAHVELADRELVLAAPEEEAATSEELSDEDIAELNVDEVKDHVRDGVVDAERALDIEYAGKNRKTLIEWLEDRVGADEEKVAEEPAEPEAADEDVEEDSESESGEETYDLPAETLDVFRDGTIDEGKDAAQELGKDEFEKLLNFEEAHQNRKGMKKFLQSNMN